MNGLDPAGMLEMREMILSLVAEGRTVVLSSHLLDEVERTCDAVAIVDRGKVDPAGTHRRAAGRFGIRAPDRLLRRPSGPRACWPARRGGRGSTSARTACGSTWPPAPTATSSPRSTGSSSRAGSPSTASRRSTPRSSPGSSRSPADWGHRNDHLHRSRRTPPPSGTRRDQPATTGDRGCPTAP